MSLSTPPLDVGGKKGFQYFFGSVLQYSLQQTGIYQVSGGLP
jgi:hypothetical protein